MKVLSFSLDPQILKSESVVASRSIRYGSVIDAFTVIVPSHQKVTVTLSDHVIVYGTGGTFKLAQLIGMFLLARKLCATEQYDVVSSQDTYFLGLLAWLVGKKYKMGIEVQVLGIEKLSFLRKKLSQFVLTHAGSIRVLSTGLKKRLVIEFGIPEDKMLLVPIYVDVSSLGFNKTNLTDMQRNEIQTQEKKFKEKYANRFNIVSVNRLVSIKNIPMQLTAIARLQDSFPNLLLHIVGEGPLHDALQQQIETMHLQEHVILEGFKSGPELSPFFSQSDCFVLTSDFEGYGMVVIEAATAGLPIVMTDVGCAGEVIVNEQSGLVIPPKATDQLQHALEKIITNQTLRTHLKEGALSSIRDLPTFETVLERYKASWQQALDNRV